MNLYRYIYLFSLLFIGTGVAFSQCTTTAIDLRTWSQLGPPSQGNWSVNGAGTSVFQSINGQNTFFGSPDNYINVDFQGFLRTTDNDDDQMGFCFGIVGNPEVDPTYSYFKLQWDDGGAGDGMYLYEVNETGNVANLYSNPGFHWTRGFNHAFRVIYTATYLEIYIDGNFISRVEGCFPPGKFSFFNRSQGDCTYSNISSVNYLDFEIPEDTVCLGDTAHMYVICDNSASAAAYYDSVWWNFGDGTPTVAGNGSLYQTYHLYQNIGDYTVTVITKDRNGCYETSTANMRIEPGFPVTLGADTIMCMGEQYPLSVSTVAPNIISQYLWFDGTTNPTRVVDSTGDFIVEVRNQHQCIGKDTIHVEVPDSIKINVSTTDLLCFQDNTGRIDVSATGSVGPTYQFQLNTGNFVDSTYFSGLNATTFTVTARDQIGCLKDTTITLNEPALLQISRIFKKDERCFDLCDGIAAFTGVGGTRPFDFTASAGTEIFDSAFMSLCDGNHVAYVTDAHGCIDSTSFEILGPSKVTISSSIDSICINSPTSIDASANGGVILPGSDYTYNWTNNGSVQGQPLTNVFPTKDTVYHVFAIDDSACHSDTISVFINIDPVIDFTSPLPDSCVKHRVQFEPVVTNNVQVDYCRWSYGNGQFSDICVNHAWDYNVDGSYDVSYTVTTYAGCQTTVTKPNFVTIYPLPIPDFDFESTAPPRNATVFNPVYKFFNQAINTSSFIWKMDDIGYDSSANPTYTFPDVLDDVEYDITMYAISPDGCTDSITKTVVVENEFFMFIPNSFTPNGDGVNDLFYPNTNGITFDTYEFFIYDKWGKLVFSTTDQNHPGWDGRIGGNAVGKTDVFTWRLKGFIYLNTDRERLVDDYGTITLLK